MEAGRWLGKVVSWPFNYGYQLIWGDDVNHHIPVRERSTTPLSGGRRHVRSSNSSGSGGSCGGGSTDWALAPTLAAWKSGSLEDLALYSVIGGVHSDDINGESSSQPSHSLLSVPIPVEEESFPAYLASLPDLAFPRYRLVLPKKSKILVLDLDETLVHSTSTSAEQCDFMVEVLVEHMSCLYYVHKRPFVEHFLDVVSNWYQLVVYTASLREYADPVVNMLDRGRRMFQKRLFRTACIEKDGMYLKDLTLIDHDLSRVSLLDNSAVSFILNPDNGIFIDSWLDDKKDTCLLDLLPFLDALRFTEDVRSILSLRTFV